MPSQGTNRASVDGHVFEKFRTDHPKVEEVIADWALAEWSDGATYLSFSELWSRYRRTQGQQGGRVQFGMDDALAPYMVRLVVTLYPEVRHLFELRPASGADSWWTEFVQSQRRSRDVPRPRTHDEDPPR